MRISSKLKRSVPGCRQPSEDGELAKEGASGNNAAHRPEDSPTFKVEY
jgi:hypothetical protein